jgi:hypothetical protein
MTLETIDSLGDDPAVRFPPIATRPIPAHASKVWGLVFGYPRDAIFGAFWYVGLSGIHLAREGGLRPSYCVGSTFLQWPRSSGG